MNRETIWCEHITVGGKRFITQGMTQFDIDSDWKACPVCLKPRPEEKRGLREALEGMVFTYDQLLGLIWKTHISSHATPLNPPETCTICKDLTGGAVNVEFAKKLLVKDALSEGKGEV